MSAFSWLAGLSPADQLIHRNIIHVQIEQYFSPTTISRNSIFQSCRIGPRSLLSKERLFSTKGKEKERQRAKVEYPKGGGFLFASFLKPLISRPLMAT